jgi:hypothetical protein
VRRRGRATRRARQRGGPELKPRRLRRAVGELIRAAVPGARPRVDLRAGAAVDADIVAAVGVVPGEVDKWLPAWPEVTWTTAGMKNQTGFDSARVSSSTQALAL